MGYEVIPGRENHFLDCRNYARCAAYVAQMDRFQESDWQAFELAAGYAAEEVQPPPGLGAPTSAAEVQTQSDQRWIPRRGGWLKPRR